MKLGIRKINNLYNFNTSVKLFFICSKVLSSLVTPIVILDMVGSSVTPTVSVSIL